MASEKLSVAPAGRRISKAGSKADVASALIRRDTVNYLDDAIFRDADAMAHARHKRALSRLLTAINDADAAVFVKPGGLCPFCNMAVSLLTEEQTAGVQFDLAISDLLGDERDALQHVLQVMSEGKAPMIKYPVIFIRGKRLEGGYTELKEMQDAATLRPAMSEKRVLFEPTEEAQRAPLLGSKPRLLYQAGGGNWLSFQRYLFSNVLRVIAAFQCALFAAALLLWNEGVDWAALTIVGFVGLDSLLFVLCGPTPFSPLGDLATLVVWKRRGGVTSAIPYKVTFAGYALACIASLFSGALSSRAIVATGLTNSALLAIFRFCPSCLTAFVVYKFTAFVSWALKTSKGEQ